MSFKNKPRDENFDEFDFLDRSGETEDRTDVYVYTTDLDSSGKP